MAQGGLGLGDGAEPCFPAPGGPLVTAFGCGTSVYKESEGSVHPSGRASACTNVCMDDSLISAGPGGRDSAHRAGGSGQTPDSMGRPRGTECPPPTFHGPARPSCVVHTVTVCFPVQSRICSSSIRTSSKSLSSLIYSGEGCYFCLCKWGDRLRAEEIFSLNVVCRGSLRSPACSWMEIWSPGDRTSFLCAMETGF